MAIITSSKYIGVDIQTKTEIESLCNILTENPWDEGASFAHKVSQIVTKMEKQSRTFSDQISVNFSSERQNVLKSDLKKSRLFPLLDIFTHFGA